LTRSVTCSRSLRWNGLITVDGMVGPPETWREWRRST
jgi:hypothetical protein